MLFRSVERHGMGAVHQGDGDDEAERFGGEGGGGSFGTPPAFGLEPSLDRPTRCSASLGSRCDDVKPTSPSFAAPPALGRVTRVMSAVADAPADARSGRFGPCRSALSASRDPVDAEIPGTLRRAGGARIDLLSEDASVGLYESFPHLRKPGFRLYPFHQATED